MVANDAQMVLKNALENNTKIQAMANAYAELTEPEKALFRWAAGINQDTVSTRKTRETSVVRERDERSQVQPLVRSLMKTLLEDHPTLLTESDIRNLRDGEYCKEILGLRIGNLALLRNIEAGNQVSGHTRYWATPFAMRFYVSNNWWSYHHLENARALARFIDDLMGRNPDHSGFSSLVRHKQAFQDYINCP